MYNNRLHTKLNLIHFLRKFETYCILIVIKTIFCLKYKIYKIFQKKLEKKI